MTDLIRGDTDGDRWQLDDLAPIFPACAVPDVIPVLGLGAVVILAAFPPLVVFLANLFYAKRNHRRS